VPKIFPPADRELARGVGIPRAGEIYSAADAKRLVGAGLASRTDPRDRTPRPPSKRARPAREG
jgi:hypothetical protein